MRILSSERDSLGWREMLIEFTRFVLGGRVDENGQDAKEGLKDEPSKWGKILHAVSRYRGSFCKRSLLRGCQ